MSEFYILNGKEAVPVGDDVLEWAQAFKGNRRVASDTLGDVHVSTVFLGLDHQYGDGPPLIFETMIFGGPHDQEQWRYSTWDEADAGHAEAVALVKAGAH